MKPPPLARAGPAWVACIGLALAAGLLLVLVGRPVATDDLWWHLATGEVYATETLWPQTDPMLFTAGDRTPMQHEWAFGAGVWALERAVGLHGLRVVHALAVAGILAFVFVLFRRESGRAGLAAFATTVFLVLSWRRLQQLRPDLFSIPAMLALFPLLFASRPSWPRVALVAALFGVWANVHSLFAAGLLLGAAGWVGIVVRGWIERRAGEPDDAERAGWGRRVAAAVGLGFVAGLVNPRGIDQHLTFLEHSGGSAIWAVRDEWARFPLFSPPAPGAPALDRLSWATAEALLLAFLVAGALGALALLRRPTRSWRLAIDPVLGALAGAACVALATSVRFLWMGCFPLLFLLHAARAGAAIRPALLRRVELATAAATLGLGVGFATLDDWQGIAAEIVREPRGYAASHLSRRYLGPAIAFLEDAGLEGKLFNPYHVGGYAGWRLAPRIRTFIDGRTADYPPEIMDDYLAVKRAGNRADRRDALERLAERDVDLFLGAGLPDQYYDDLYTIDVPAGRPDWVLVFRSDDHSIYLRRTPRNGINLWRVAQYYRERGIPFDPDVGFRPRDAVSANPEWAIAHGLIPPRFHHWQALREDEDPQQRLRALDVIANAWWLLGETKRAEQADLEALALDPDAREPRLRLANLYLRQRRIPEAEHLARELYESDPGDRSTRSLYQFLLARRYER